MYREVYSFGADEKNKVSKTTFFSEEKGFGFVDLQNVNGKTAAEKGLMTGGWMLRKSLGSDWHSSAVDTEQGVYVKAQREAIVFKAAVPSWGTYKISVRMTADAGAVSHMRLWGIRRNLIAGDIAVAADDVFQKSFYVNVTPYIPALTSIPFEEKAIYLSVTGENAGFSEIIIEKAEVPVLYIAGDSTLTDQNAFTPYYPFGSGCGWAQNMAQFFNTAAVCNYAHSGLTTNCFRDDGHMDILMSFLKKGDCVLLQFGHNDQKRRNLAAFGGYINNIRWYIKKIQEKGAYPIICSPISRIPFKDEDTGKMCSLLSWHALAAKEAAEELSAPFIDLHALTFEKWLSLGADVQDYFADMTHTKDYGAAVIAGIVEEEIRRQDIAPLCQWMQEESAISRMLSSIRSFTPDTDTKELPSEPEEPGMFDIAIPYVDIDGIKKYNDIVKAFRGGLLDPCIMHLHPADPMPRAQLLMVLFKALRISGKRPYEGKYTDIARYEWDSSFIEASIAEHLIDESTVPNGQFRPDDALTAGEFASFCERGIEKDIAKRTMSLMTCFDKAQKDGILDASAAPDDQITRADVYAGLVRVMELLDTADMALPSDAEIHPVG